VAVYWESIKWVNQVLEECVRQDLALPTCKSDSIAFSIFSEADKELEKDANDLISCQTFIQLDKFLQEIETSLRIDPSLWSQNAYWQKVMLKTKLKVSTDLIEAIYYKYAKDNKDLVQSNLKV
jgi:hypothetical protein